MHDPRRPTKFIVVQHGMPYTADEMPPTLKSLSRIDVIRRTWEVQHVFDDSSHYRYAVTDPPEVSGFAAFLAYTIYNPRTVVSCSWNRTGNYAHEAVISAVETGLQTDDDIIQQWFGAGQVLELLAAAQSWSDMLLAVEAVGGSHEVYPDVQKYVERVLGKEE